MDYLIKELIHTKVILYGAGEKGEYALNYLLENNIEPLYVVDSESNKSIHVKNKEKSFKTIKPDLLFNEDKSGLIIVIAVEYPLCSDIGVMLSEKGFSCYYYNRNITTCDLLQHHLGFYNDKIGFCCGAHNKFHINRPLFSYFENAEDTINNILEIRHSIIKGLNCVADTEIAKSCEGCCRLKIVQNHLSDIGYGIEKFSLINISCYPSICQAKCIYCSVPNDQNNNYQGAQQSNFPKMIAAMIQYLLRNNLIEEKCRFQFAPAEITITPFKKELLEATEGFDSTYLTNGYIFDQQIADSLSNNDSMISLSLDCGTRETFRLIKGNDMFEKVVDNIRSYRSHGRVGLKYNILPGINDNKNDIDGMIKLIKELNLNNINLSFDYVTPLRVSFFGIVKFVESLEKNGIRFYFHAYYQAEEIKKIISEYWNKELQDYYEKKESVLSNTFFSNNDYMEYREYLYQIEINDLLAFFRKKTSFAFIGNYKAEKIQWIMSAFYKLGVPVLTAEQKNAEDFFNSLNNSTDILIVGNSKEYCNKKVNEYADRKRLLDLEKYFYSLVPTKIYLNDIIDNHYLHLNTTKKRVIECDIINLLKNSYHKLKIKPRETE